MVKKTIYLDKHVRQKIVDLLKVHDLLIQHRNARLDRLSAVLYGIAIVSGFWLLMGFIVEGGWYPIAPALALTLAVSWLSAERVERVEKNKPIKLNIR